MVQYRRNLAPGGTYFFTVTLRDRRSSLLTDHVHLLREAFRITLEKSPFMTDAVVIMPDHIHAVWSLPENDADYSGRWRSIKSRFTRALVKAGVKLHRDARGEYALWQRRFWEHTIRDDNDLARHVAYIHYNPVKHGLVGQVKDWPWSSFHRYVRDSMVSEDWGGSSDEQGDFGEP
jgi:putative transposase